MAGSEILCQQCKDDGITEKVPILDVTVWTYTLPRYFLQQNLGTMHSYVMLASCLPSVARK